MNAADFQTFIESSRVSLGEVNRLCIGPEAPARLRKWAEILAAVDLDDAHRCLTEIENGTLDAPKFDEWTRYAGFVRRWCKLNPKLRFDYVTIHYAEEPRYRCLLCRDSGIVSCINAKWLDHHRPAIESGTVPFTLYRDAFKWCRVNNVGPFKYAIACKCHTGERRTNVALSGRFDSASHVHDTGDFDADCQRWLTAHRAAQPAGYYVEFA